MELVAFEDEILANLLLLNEYILHPRNAEVRSRAIELIRRGHNFVAYRRGDHWLLAPSRFAGYIGNTMQKHQNFEGRHGEETDQAIRRALHRSNMPNDELERVYQNHCAQHGVQPEERQRRFWTIQ